jgi:hypothetical protein
VGNWNRRLWLRTAILLMLGASAMPWPAGAQAPSDASRWTCALTPCAWLMAINGKVTAATPAVDVNASFIDILGKTDTLVGLMAYGGARKAEYALCFDFVVTQLTASGGFAAARNPLPRPTGGHCNGRRHTGTASANAS